MKYYLVFVLVVSSMYLSLAGRGISSRPEISLKMLDKRYDFVNHIAYADLYLEKTAADACISDTCYQEHSVVVYALKRDLITSRIVDTLKSQAEVIAASTNATSTFIGSRIMNDRQYYYEYYVREGDSYKVANNIPIVMRYFPNKHLSKGHYGLLFSSDSCFNGKVTIFRGDSVTDNAKTLNHKVRIYYKIGVNSELPQEFSTVFEVSQESITESVTFVNLELKACNTISFYQVSSVEIEN